VHTLATLVTTSDIGVHSKPYLEDDEAEIFLAKADALAADGLPGHDDKRLMEAGRELMVKLATGEADEKKRKRLLSAECSRRWLKRLRNDKRNNVVAAQGTMRKQSQMSRARAAAKNPVINTAMFEKIDAQYVEHYEAGILKTRRPEGEQIYGGDEVGVNPSGHTGRRVFCSLMRQQIVVLTDGEGGKASFWVTFFFWSRGDGQFVIPPTVVHQAAELSELHALNLPLDWCVHCSASGYMDKDGWLTAGSRLLATSSGTVGRNGHSTFTLTATIAIGTRMRWRSGGRTKFSPPSSRHTARRTTTSTTTVRTLLFMRPSMK
jgi:hypothetical protein